MSKPDLTWDPSVDLTHVHLDSEDYAHSLSETIDYEPRLEFDELVLPGPSTSVAVDSERFMFGLRQHESVSVMDIDDDMFEFPSMDCDNDFLRQSGAIRVFKDDEAPIPTIIVISACKLPDRTECPTETLFT